MRRFVYYDDRIRKRWFILKKHACQQFIQLCLKQVLWGIALNSDALHLWHHFSAAYLSQSTFSNLTRGINSSVFSSKKSTSITFQLFVCLVDDGFVAIYHLKCCYDFHIGPKLKRGSLLIPTVQFRELTKSENMQFMHLNTQMVKNGLDPVHDRKQNLPPLVTWPLNLAWTC